jgi:hypothetical protein
MSIMKLKQFLLTIIALATFGGGAAAAYEYKVVRIDLPNGSPVFAVRRVETPATIAVYTRGGRAYRTSDQARIHEREAVSQMQVGNSSPVTLRGRAH